MCGFPAGSHDPLKDFHIQGFLALKCLTEFLKRYPEEGSQLGAQFAQKRARHCTLPQVRTLFLMFLSYFIHFVLFFTFSSADKIFYYFYSIYYLDSHFFFFLSNFFSLIFQFFSFSIKYYEKVTIQLCQYTSDCLHLSPSPGVPNGMFVRTCVREEFDDIHFNLNLLRIFFLSIFVFLIILILNSIEILYNTKISL